MAYIYNLKHHLTQIKVTKYNHNATLSSEVYILEKTLIFT